MGTPKLKREPNILKDKHNQYNNIWNKMNNYSPRDYKKFQTHYSKLKQKKWTFINKFRRAKKGKLSKWKQLQNLLTIQTLNVLQLKIQSFSHKYRNTKLI